MSKKKVLLWIGDAAVASGFARCTHYTLKAFEPTWDINVLGLNYQGDPHKFPYLIFPCWPGGDLFGVGRVKEIVEKLSPDVIIIQNDPWNIPAYLEVTGNVPVVGVIPVDGKNCQGAGLNGMLLSIFWTEFGLKEARAGSYSGEAAVIPLGIDLDIYKQMDKTMARRIVGLPEHLAEVFIVGNVNRNQPRKRLDLTIKYFAEWIINSDIRDAYLFLHVAPTGEMSYDVMQLMKYYGLSNRLILSEPDLGHGVHESALAATYGTFDIQVTTTQGEGWGLTQMEGMACGIPQVVPDWAALGEWAKDAALLVPCSSTAVTPNKINVIGGIPDKGPFIEAMDRLYRETPLYIDLRKKGLELVKQPQFNWANIGEAFRTVVEGALFPKIIKPDNVKYVTIHPPRGDGVLDAIDNLNDSLGAKEHITDG